MSTARRSSSTADGWGVEWTGLDVQLLHAEIRPIGEHLALAGDLGTNECTAEFVVTFNDDADGEGLIYAEEILDGVVSAARRTRPLTEGLLPARETAQRGGTKLGADILQAMLQLAGALLSLLRQERKTDFAFLRLGRLHRELQQE